MKSKNLIFYNTHILVLQTFEVKMLIKLNSSTKINLVIIQKYNWQVLDSFTHIVIFYYT